MLLNLCGNQPVRRVDLHAMIGPRHLIYTQGELDGIARRADARLGRVLAVLVGAPAHLDLRGQRRADGVGRPKFDFHTDLDEQHLLEARPRHDFDEAQIVLPCGPAVPKRLDRVSR